MTWIVRPAVTTLAARAKDWDRLNAEIHDRHPLLDSRFVGALLDHFGSGKELLCVHHTGTQIDGALIVTPCGIGRWTTFLPSPAQIGPQVLRSARPLETLFFALPGHAWSIDLRGIASDFCLDWSGLSLPWLCVSTSSIVPVEFQGLPTSIHSVDSPSVETAGSLSDRADSGTKLRVVTDAKLIDCAVERYNQLDPFETKDGPGKLASFLADVMQRFAATGGAIVPELYVGSQLAASWPLIRNGSQWVDPTSVGGKWNNSVAHAKTSLSRILFDERTRENETVLDHGTNTTETQGERRRMLAHYRITRDEAVAFTHTLAAPWMAFAEARSGKLEQSGVNSVRAYAKVDSLPAGALALINGHDPQHCESSVAWYGNLQRTVFRDDPGVRYYVAGSGDAPKAILPLRHHKNGWSNRIDALGNYYTSLYGPALAPDSGAYSLASILATATGAQGVADVMRFEPMDPGSPGYSLMLSAMRSVGWIPFRFFCFGNWHLTVTGDSESYLRQREGILRSTLRRKAKKFESDHGTMEVVVTPDSIEPAIKAYNEVYANSWKRPEPYPEFVPGLIRWLASEGKLRLGIARRGDRPIAAQIWIVSHGKASIFKLAYDEAHADSGAGTLLTAHLMQYVIDRDGVVEVDYLIGDDPHKQYWMDRRRERWGIVAYNPKTIVGVTLLFAEIIGRTIRKMTQPLASQTVESDQAVQWHIVPITRFAELGSEWDELQARTTRVPFLESLFLEPLLSEFGTGNEVVAIGRQQGRWCAAAVLARSRTGVWETFQPSQLPLGAWISSLESESPALYTSLMRALPGANVALSITQQDSLLRQRPDDSPSVQTLDYITTAWVDIDRQFDAYWDARGKNLRTNTRKQRTKLESEGVTMTLDCITDPRDVESAINDYGALESAGWKGKDGTAVHAGNAQGRFYRRMLENFCATGRGRIYRYRFNEKPVAMDLCIEFGDSIVILKTAYDESFKTVSPSTLMRQDEFRMLFDQPHLRRIEFYGKVMEWHTRWTDNSRMIYHVTAYRWAWLARMHALRRRRQAAGAQAPAPAGNEQ